MPYEGSAMMNRLRSIYRNHSESRVSAKYITTWQALLFCTNCDIIVLVLTNSNKRLVVMKTAEQYK